MGIARVQGHIEAPIETVFDYAVDFRHTPEWNVSVIEMTAQAPLKNVGDPFQGTMKFLGRTYTGEGHVTEIVRPTVIAFTSTSPDGGRQDWTCRLTPAMSGTDFEVVIDYDVPKNLLGAIADKLFIERMVQRNLEQSRDNFIALVEHAVLQPV